MARTQQERKAETRARLLAAAADLFADQGIDAVSVDAVAEAAGRTSGAVYAHFGSKQGLLLALLDSWKDSGPDRAAGRGGGQRLPRRPAGGRVVEPVGPLGRGGRPAGRCSSRSCGCGRPGTPRSPTSSGSATPRPCRYSARQLDGWTAAVGARPAAAPEELAVLVKALLTGLALQKRLAPDSVPDDLALRGIAALVGLPGTTAPTGRGRPGPTPPDDPPPSDRRPDRTH